MGNILETAQTFALKADVLAAEDFWNSLDFNPEAAKRGNPGGWENLRLMASQALEASSGRESIEDLEQVAFSMRRGLTPRQFARQTNRY